MGAFGADARDRPASQAGHIRKRVPQHWLACRITGSRPHRPSSSTLTTVLPTYRPTPAARPEVSLGPGGPGLPHGPGTVQGLADDVGMAGVLSGLRDHVDLAARTLSRNAPHAATGCRCGSAHGPELSFVAGCFPGSRARLSVPRILWPDAPAVNGIRPPSAAAEGSSRAGTLRLDPALLGCHTPAAKPAPSNLGSSLKLTESGRLHRQVCSAGLRRDAAPDWGTPSWFPEVVEEQEGGVMIEATLK